jgi:hypothetical protein
VGNSCVILYDSVWRAEHHFHSFGGLFFGHPVLGLDLRQETLDVFMDQLKEESWGQIFTFDLYTFW